MRDSPCVDKGLHFIAYSLWPIPEACRKGFYVAMRRSTCSRVLALKQQLALIGYANFNAFLLNIGTPKFMVELVDDLVATASLTRKEGSAIQDALLHHVRADGKWIDYAEYERHQP